MLIFCFRVNFKRKHQEVLIKKEKQLIWWVHTHTAPLHLDELVMFLIFRLFGDRVWDIKSDVRLADWLPPSARSLTAPQLEEIGILQFGVGGGRFDEHATEKSERKGQSGTELLAKFLKVEREPAVRRLIELVNASESGRWREAAKKLPQGVSAVKEFTLSALVRLMSSSGKTPDELVRYFQPIFDAHVAGQLEFQVAASSVRDVGEFRDVEFVGGKVKAYVAETAMPKVHTAAANAGAKVVVIRNPKTGQTFVSASTKSNISLAVAASALRVAEAEARGDTLDMADAAGEHLAAPNDAWHYQAGAENVFNGRANEPVAKPTKLTLGQVADIVLKNLIHSRQQAPA